MSGLISAIFFLGDLIFLNLSIYFSYFFLGIQLTGQERINSIYLFIFSNLAWLFLLLSSNPYSLTRNSGVAKIVKTQLSFVFIQLLVVVSLIFFLKKSYAPLQIGLLYLLFVPTFFFWKFFVMYLLNVFSKSSFGVRNIIIVGTANLAEELKHYFEDHIELKHQVLELFRSNDRIPLEPIQLFCKENVVHEIYCQSNFQNNEIKQLIDFGLDSMIRVKLLTDFRQFQQNSLEPDLYDQVPVFNITTIPLDDTKNQVAKRIFDIAFSLTFIVTVLSWLLPIIALVIKLDSRGPVFFKQKRSGKDNKPFYCLKFRTMKVNAEADTKQATSNDSRITKVGSFLRKTSLDEFPQFFNVLYGTMSIVGPRPHMLKHTEQYSKLIDRFMGRHYVKPGITGLAQSMGYRGETKDLIDMKNRVRMDRFYIENWSLFFDIKIIIQTVTSLLRGSEKAF
ncbi:MAG TPA: exopolysaccharide biosynthesis polyprenyl glycosylphosphotransferase [Cyclobacteriaceae bacterium]|jgi:Undecaprenyl-phosphate glucose phosphotransferase|nr:exopolysaccharide biosynthesis polyprenyl glycosylphosphotransferase [Cyclobacteriaceae bacterium]